MKLTGWMAQAPGKPMRPEAREEQPGPGEEHGRGVPLIDVLSRRWGTDYLAVGKRVFIRTVPLTGSSDLAVEQATYTTTKTKSKTDKHGKTETETKTKTETEHQH